MKLMSVQSVPLPIFACWVLALITPALPWQFGSGISRSLPSSTTLLDRRAPASASTSGPSAVTKNGTYEGLHLTSYNQDLFLGIPYAQPPVGALRFTVPQSLNATFSGARQATAYYPECVGYGGDDVGYDQSEDCLALNVIRPTGYDGKERQSLPVAVWIHGGGLQMGGTVDTRYNLSFIVENSVAIGKPVIAVSIGYRLAGWGFLYSSEVQGSGQTNLGFRDQRLALHWIQENIAAFGGDPSKVTVWGESAGALSVGMHLVAYGGRDDKLFRAAVMESGNPVNYAGFRDARYYQPLYDAIVHQSNCSHQVDTLGCLRNIPYEQLNAVFNQSSFNSTMGRFNPVIDGDFIQKFTSIQLADGEFVHVPIISGANTDEGSAFGPTGIQNSSQFAAYLQNATEATGVALPAFFAQEILNAYPDNPSLGIPAELGSARLNAHYGYEYRRTSAYAGDAVFIANRRLTCQMWSAAGVPAYCYRFNAIPAGIPPEIGVTHFQEVSFVFNNINGLGYAIDPFLNKSQSYQALSKLMSASWASFFHDLDPNSFRKGSNSTAGAQIAGAAAMWPVYGAGRNMVWDANVTSYVEDDDFRSAGIDLINDASVLYHR